MEIQMELQLVFDESISSNQLDPDTRKLHQKKWREKNPQKTKNKLELSSESSFCNWTGFIHAPVSVPKEKGFFLHNFY